METYYIPCEICEINPAYDVKEGVNHNGERGLWLVCKECAEKIKDERKHKRNS